VADVHSADGFDPSVDANSGYTTRDLMAVPVLDRRGRTLGVLEVMNSQESGGFNDRDEAYLSAIATQAAVAIQNANVYAELERERVRLERENRSLRKRRTSSSDAHPNRPLGNHQAFVDVLDIVERVAESDATVLIRGESGTGKGVVARYLHALIGRKSGPFVQINCSAIPDTLIESELFGVESGVATGVSARRGRIEMAEGGTCFLDEIGDMSASAQAKILTAIEERRVERVGGRGPVDVDVRVIAATHQDLDALVADKQFRADLYHRLNVVSVELPSLRDRKEDILPLAESFLRAQCEDSKTADLRHYSPECEQALLAYSWPGNVRELENVVERAVLLSKGDVVGLSALPTTVRRSAGGLSSSMHGSDPASETPAAQYADLREALGRYERSLLVAAMRDAKGVQQKAARELGISESNLRYKLKKHGLDSDGAAA